MLPLRSRKERYKSFRRVFKEKLFEGGRDFFARIRIKTNMGDINANKLSGDECVGCSVQPPPPLSPPPPALESVEAETSDSELLGTVVGAGTGTGTEEEVGSTIGSESTEKGVSKS